MVSSAETDLSTYVEPLQLLTSVDVIQISTKFGIESNFNMKELQLGISTYRLQVPFCIILRVSN